MYSQGSHRNGVLSGEMIKNKSLGQKFGMNKTAFVSLMILTTLASSLTLPLFIAKSPFTSMVAWIVCLLCGTVIVFTSPRPLIIGLAFISVFFIISFTGSPILSALIIGIIFAIGTGSALFCMEKSVGISTAILLPIASYGIAYLASGNVFISAVSLPLYVPMVAMSITSRADTSRTVRILAPSIASLILIGGGLLASIYYTFGNISLTSIYTAISNLNANLAAIMLSIIDFVGQRTITGAVIRDTYTLIENILNLAPGLISALCLVMMYLSNSIQHFILTLTDSEKYDTENSRKLNASVEAAMIYTVCFVLSFASGSAGGASLVAVIAANLCYMLLPILALMGWEAIQKLIVRFIFFGFLIAISVAMVIFWLSSAMSVSVLLLLALLGAIYIIITRIDKWANEHYSKGELHE